LVTEFEAEKLYRMKKWIIEDELKWELRNNKYYLKATLLTEDGTELTLRGTKHIKFSFCILYRNVIPIRRFDFYESHTNPDGTKISGGKPHKHKWDGLNCNYAYEVDDIDISNVNKALFDFLDECNIEYKGKYQLIMDNQKKSEE